MKKLFIVLLLALCLPGAIFAAEEEKNPLEAWQPAFDPSKADFTYILSNVSHPVIKASVWDIVFVTESGKNRQADSMSTFVP